MNEITKELYFLHALFLRVNPLMSKSFEKQLCEIGFLPAEIHAMDGELCWVLTLDTDEHMLAAMRKSTRYDIRRAQKLGITIKSTADTAQLGDFFRLYKDTAVRHGFVAHQGIREEFEIFTKAGKARLYFAQYENQILAATIILYCDNQAIYHHSASARTNLPLTHLLQWQAICDARDKGLQYYNFWGIAPEGVRHHPWNGITTFKTGFGGNRREYIHSHDMPLSKLYILPRTIERLRAWQKGYSSLFEF